MHHRPSFATESALRLGRRWTAAAWILALGLSAPALAATPSRLAWSTYLRSGPAQTSRALEELEHDTALVVEGCSGGWCRVSADGLNGFIDQDALTLPRVPAPKAAAVEACVVVGQADSRAPRPARFCSPSPSPKAAPAT